MSVVLENLTKKFKEVVAVNNLSLTIDPNDFLVLLGPSGCGKTTTLRLIAGLETLTSGNIYIGDRLVNKVPPKDRNIAMVFQSYALYPHMTVFDNMALALRAKKVPKEEINERVTRVAELLGISDLLKRKPAQLSGGQRQRVALGRAIVRQPTVFLMDEPLSNLDAKLRVRMRAELKKLFNTLNTPFIYVTHDQVEAMTLGSRIALMNYGVLQQLGTPYELFNHPVNEFVAGFIGTPPMNMHEGTLIEKDGKSAIDTGSFIYKFPKDLDDLLRSLVGSEVVLGVRPEDTVVNGDASLEGFVEVIEPLGSEMIIHIRLGDITHVAQLRFEEGLEVGNKLRFGFDVKKLHVFYKGKAIF